MNLRQIKKRLKELADPGQAAILQGFFKTGPGQYGEGDLFLGIRVPVLRKLIPEFRSLPMVDLAGLLDSHWHEQRFLALLLMMDAYKRGQDPQRQGVYELYMSNTRFINNWDLVDVSAPHIVGRHLTGGDRRPLYSLAVSLDLWERRIAIISTFYFIRQNQFSDTLRIAALLLDDKQDLIHKAVGWMLREVGKRDLEAEKEFLLPHCRQMPRTMLRYAIERFAEPLRKSFLAGNPD
jgi:3-methyladenine DNA glycosylase AlkD